MVFLSSPFPVDRHLGVVTQRLLGKESCVTTSKRGFKILQRQNCGQVSIFSAKCLNSVFFILIFFFTKIELLVCETFFYILRHCSTIIKKCVNATEEDVVVFTGSGTTSAIHKLIHALQIEERKHEKHVSILSSLNLNQRRI